MVNYENKNDNTVQKKEYEILDKIVTVAVLGIALFYRFVLIVSA